jgi:hypothetical protein
VDDNTMNNRLLYLATLAMSLLATLVTAGEITSAAAPMIHAEITADADASRAIADGLLQCTGGDTLSSERRTSARGRQRARPVTIARWGGRG